MEFNEKKGLSESDPSKIKEIIQANLRELERRKKEGEIDSEDYNPIYLYYLTSEGLPVSLSDVQRYAENPNGQAINITREELEILEEETGFSLKVVLVSGEVVEIDSHNNSYAKDDRLIIFPEELGEIPITEQVNPLVPAGT